MLTPATSKTRKPGRKGKDRVVKAVADKFTAAKEKIISLTHKEKRVVANKAKPVGKTITAAKKVAAESKTVAKKAVKKAVRKVSRAK